MKIGTKKELTLQIIKKIRKVKIYRNIIDTKSLKTYNYILLQIKSVHSVDKIKIYGQL